VDAPVPPRTLSARRLGRTIVGSREVGRGDFADPLVVPGPVLRSRHPETESDDGPATELVADAGDLRCPECGGRFPGIATHCPDDGTPLSTADSVE
jgi:hypothetical protein